MRIAAAAFLLLCPLAALPQQDTGDVPDIVMDIGTRAPIRLTRFPHDEAAIAIDGHIREAAWLEVRAASAAGHGRRTCRRDYDCRCGRPCVRRTS